MRGLGSWLVVCWCPPKTSMLMIRRVLTGPGMGTEHGLPWCSAALTSAGTSPTTWSATLPRRGWVLRILSPLLLHGEWQHPSKSTCAHGPHSPSAALACSRFAHCNALYSASTTTQSRTGANMPRSSASLPPPTLPSQRTPRAGYSAPATHAADRQHTQVTYEQALAAVFVEGW